MAAPSEVKVNIRHNVLILKTFTVPQLQAITGLKRQSIHTEVRRMEQEGLVSRVGIEEGKKGSTGGRPPVIYQLAPDPEKRFEVLQTVRAFYVAMEEQPSELPRPESKHYFIAKEMVKETTEKGATLTQDEKSEQLALIKKRLEYARQEEEVGEEGTQLIAASFDVLEAKAINALAGDWKSASRLLNEARKVCQQIEADDLVAEVDSYVQGVVDILVKKHLQFIRSGMYGEAEHIIKELDIADYCFGDVPGIHIHQSIEQANTIATMARGELFSVQAEQRPIQIVVHAWNQRRRALIDQMPRATERRVYFIEPSPEVRLVASEAWAASAVALHRRQLQGAVGGPKRSAQTDDLVKQFFGSVQAQGSEELKK